ncbi:MAG: Histidine kinase [Nocardia sp.]|uniref:sensor histidine kinase n=1 Tax=Nocardia sp. TaxID=1821 RepID=UPI0026086074|nr:histidine kinase [Nocardia sp.]MCU1647790.1 Histidine kinase [Nocardia sp.]
MKRMPPTGETSRVNGVADSATRTLRRLAAPGPAVTSGDVTYEDEQIGRRRRVGWVFVIVWTVYLIDPLKHAWALDQPVARIYTIAVLVAFVICYLGSYWVLFRLPLHGPTWPSPSPWLVGRLLAVLVALLLAATATLYTGANGLATYIGTFIAFALPIRRAVPLLIVLLLATAVVPQLIVGEAPDWSIMQGMALSAIAVGGVRLIIINNQALDLARKQLTELAVAEERLRVGRDVHDILGHSLTVITVKTELAQRLMDIDPERAKTELVDIERLARESLAGVRSTVGGLREISLAGELVNARTALRAAGIAADLPDGDELPIRHSIVFGWVLREAITNVVRHSGARHASVRVTPTSIEVSDDGGGMGDGARAGSGLSGLRERVQATGGTLTLSNRPEGGLRVLASFPAGTIGESR